MDSEEVCLAARRPPLRLGSIARRRLASERGRDAGQGGHSSGRLAVCESRGQKAYEKQTNLLTYLLTSLPTTGAMGLTCSCLYVGAVLAPQRAARTASRQSLLRECLSRESSTTPCHRRAPTSWPLLRSGRARPTRKRRWWPPAFTIGCRHSCSSPSPLAPLPIAARASRSVACARCKRSAPGFWATCPTCRLTPTLTPTPPQNPNA